MITPGFKSLGAFNITSAGSQVGDWVEGFEGLLALTVQMRLVWGSGGINVQAWLQTTFEQGTTPTPIDIWCALFGTASELAIENFSKLTPKTTQIAVTDGTLANDTAIDGILGSRFRIKLTSSGIYAASTQLIVGADVS